MPPLNDRDCLESPEVVVRRRHNDDSFLSQDSSGSPLRQKGPYELFEAALDAGNESGASSSSPPPPRAGERDGDDLLNVVGPDASDLDEGGRGRALPRTPPLPRRKRDPPFAPPPPSPRGGGGGGEEGSPRRSSCRGFSGMVDDALTRIADAVFDSMGCGMDRTCYEWMNVPGVDRSPCMPNQADAAVDEACARAKSL